MRIVHFSDIHVGAWPESVGAAFDKRILGLLNYTVRRRPHIHAEYIKQAIEHINQIKPDCVICSGDLTCIGSPGEFRKAQRLLRPLLENDDFEFLYVPGNHDAYVQDRYCRQALEQTFKQLNGGRWRLDQLPLRYRLGCVEFLMVNECQPTPIWGSYGLFTDKTRQAFQEWLADDAGKAEITRVLIAHYPTRGKNGQCLARRRKLRGSEPIYEALHDGRLKLSLCGHIHDSYINRFAKGGMEICSGSLTTQGCMNVVDIDAGGAVTQWWKDVRSSARSEAGGSRK